MEKVRQPTLLFRCPPNRRRLPRHMIKALLNFGYVRVEEIAKQYYSPDATSEVKRILEAEMRAALQFCCDTETMYFGQHPDDPEAWGFWPKPCKVTVP